MVDTMWNDQTTTMQTLKDSLQKFNADRDWEQFHTPKDLAMCVSAEAGELLECFLWKDESSDVDLDAVQEELADIMITAANLGARLNIDLMKAVERKLAVNAERYPVALARGRATKHTHLPKVVT
jgi:dCTP diphosphatase